jgi:SAM-dependent methyltransferase
MEPTVPSVVTGTVEDGFSDYPCDLCGSSDAVLVPHCREYTNGQPIHICRDCGFVYVIRRRSAAEIADEWSDEIFGEGYTAATPAVRARLTYVAEFIDQNLGLRSKRVSDIGAGEGVFLDIISDYKYGASVFGIEPSRRNCELMEGRGTDCFRGTIEEYIEGGESVEGSADVATIMWTLENSNSCRAMLAGAHRILRDGGHVAVATGSRIRVPFKKPLWDYLGGNRADTHAFRFSANTLKGMLAVANFEVTHVNRYVDSDLLCVIGRKAGEGSVTDRSGDDYLDAHGFFERWHTDTVMYYPRANGL